MINPNYLQAITRFQSSPTICNFFQLMALDTWERIRFARTRRGLRIFETTITQNLLFEIRRTQEIVNASPLPFRWNIRIFEARNEKANGNDIELFIPFRGGYLFFAVQAKIIYHLDRTRSDGNYPMMDHHNRKSGKQQITSLIDYASNKRGYPLFLLYNFADRNIAQSTYCNIQFTKEQYGCSIISARYIRQTYYKKGTWTIPLFSDIHPANALPWFVLVCCFPQISNTQSLGRSYFHQDKDFSWKDMRIYTDNDIFESDEWMGLEDRDDFTLKVNQDDFSNLKFQPKFRIVMNLEQEARETRKF